MSISGEPAEPVATDEYRRKRDPGRTPEPFAGARRNAAAGATFVVQRHAARRLHYDFRLERHGALASWAVPKGIPLVRGERHLAVHVEDHPLEYASFEGEIPKGQYGAGTVEIWDHGTYELVEEKRDGGLTVRLQGSRLTGTWTLVPARLGGKEENWLLMRKDGDAVERKARAPMLAQSAGGVPGGDGWVFEPKWDGYRVIVAIEGGEARLTSRNGNDLTERFRPAARAVVQAVRASEAVLDGEVCALDDEGRSRFSLLQQGAGTLVVVLFDLLELDGVVLSALPLEQRRARLESAVEERDGVILSPLFDDGPALLQVAEERGLEGIVAKRLSSPYRPGKRSRDWLKIKNFRGQEVVIGGWLPGKGRRHGEIGSLLAGAFFMHFFIGSDQTAFWRGSLVTHGAEHHEVPILVMLTPTIAMAAGFAVAWYFYITNPLVPFGLSKRFRGLYQFLLNAWYFDALYDFLFVRPAQRIGRFLWKTGDGTIIDGIGPDGVAARVIDITNRVVKLQSGYIYHYAFVMLIGVALLITYFIFAGGGLPK